MNNELRRHLGFGVFFASSECALANYLAEAIFELFSVRVSCVVVVVVVDRRFWGLHIYAVHRSNIENTCMDLPVRWRISGRNLISESLLFGRFRTVTENRI